MKKIEEYKVAKVNGGIILNGNECFYDILSDYKEEVVEELLKVNFNRYPENDSLDIKSKYAKHIGVEKENIIVGHGSDEMISLVVSTFISKGKKLLTLKPDFSMYDFYVAQNEGEIIKLQCEKGGEYCSEELIELGQKENVDLIVFSNPNNPTGFGKKKDEIKKIIEGFKDKIILIDEAYIEFYGESVINEVENYKNLLVTRTLSKAFAGASLRLGFLVGNKKLIEKLNTFKVPYNVNSISQKLGEVLIGKSEKVEELIESVLEEKDRVFKELKDIEEKYKKIEVYKSNANFIFGRGNKGFLKEFEENKIIIRDFKDDSFRITIGSKNENDKMLEVLRKWAKINE